MELGIINYSYYENDNGPVFVMKCRDRDRNPYIINIQDEILDPVFYILESDFDYFKKTATSIYLWHLVKKTCEGIPTYINEKTVAIYTKYPRDVKKLRENIKGIPYFNADIKWEKKVSQQLKLRKYIEVKSNDQYQFLKVSGVKVIDSMFKVEQNICYWDIEIDGSKLKSLKDAWKTPELYDIISYAIYNPFRNEYTYYGFREDFIDETYTSIHRSEIVNSKKLEKHQMMKNYPVISNVIVKKFHDEKSMHLAFLNDFPYGDFDGILMFNGRGGNIPSKKKDSSREWRNGFDMPMFYERAGYLGINKELQNLSSIPKSTTRKYPVTKYMNFERGECKKLEVHIDNLTQHDIYFDGMVLKFTKDQEKMKDETLNSYAENFLGTTKVEHEGMVWELHYKDWEEEMHYNIIDVEIMFALDKYFSFTDKVHDLCSVYGIKMEDAMYASKVHDHIYLWYVSGEYCMDIQGQTRNRWKGFINKKIGGHNKTIEKGTVIGYGKNEFGFIIDFSKLYPSCQMSVNADIRTKVEFDHYEDGGNTVVDTFGKKYNIKDLCTPPAGFFRKDIVAQDTVIYKSLIDGRNAMDKLKAEYMKLAKLGKDVDYYTEMAKIVENSSFARKNLINGKFGGAGLQTSRNFDMVIYNTAPSMGQEILIYILETVLPKYGYNPFFASTDSAMMKAKSNTAWDTWNEASALCDLLNKDIDKFIRDHYNPIENYVQIGCEKVFSQCFLFNKRMYILKTVIEDTKDGPIEFKDPKIYIRGLEYLKNNSSMVVTDSQYKLAKMFINNESFAEIKKYIVDLDSKFNSLPWEYISGKASISKDPSEYKTTFQKAEACKNANAICGKDYREMSRPYLGYFKEIPSKFSFIKDSIYSKDGTYPIAFDKGDGDKMTKEGFKLDYDKHKDLTIASVQISRFFELIFGVTYEQITEDYSDANEV